jgi:hypothetical protein
LCRRGEGKSEYDEKQFAEISHHDRSHDSSQAVEVLETLYRVVFSVYNFTSVSVPLWLNIAWKNFTTEAQRFRDCTGKEACRIAPAGFIGNEVRNLY